MISIDHVWILALALVIDAIIGDPDWLWRRVPHPVAMIGGLIAFFDKNLNRDDLSPRRRVARGIATIGLIVFVAFGTGLILQGLFSSIAYGWIATAIVAAIMLAGRSLFDHVAAVAAAYRVDGINSARMSLARIVGRDTASLDEPGISRAAIESAAENFSDGLVAPAFWFALLGLPGLLAYKAINTADSMIGHRSERYRDFGRATARLDDVVNYLPARLSAILIALAARLVGGSVGKAFAIVASDAKKHRSPNAGWPEAAMAGALGIALAGPRPYDGVIGDDVFINIQGNTAAIGDIRRALRLYAGAWALVLSVAVSASAIFV